MKEPRRRPAVELGYKGGDFLSELSLGCVVKKLGFPHINAPAAAPG
jgi:hypothetical protein